jgi:hypothetical protein
MGGLPKLQTVTYTEIVSSTQRLTNSANENPVMCGTLWFISDRRQFWSHPSFQKASKTAAIFLKPS